MKSCTWQAPLVVRRFKSPTGPLAEVDPGMCYDFSQQRAVAPTRLGSNTGRQTMNAGGMAAKCEVSSLETNGTGSPFIAPFMKPE